MVNIEKVKDFMKYLDKVQKDNDFLNFEIAWLIKNFEDYTENEITDDIIKNVYDYLEYIAEIFDDYVVECMTKLVKGEKID